MLGKAACKNVLHISRYTPPSNFVGNVVPGRKQRMDLAAPSISADLGNMQSSSANENCLQHILQKNVGIISEFSLVKNVLVLWQYCC